MKRTISIILTLCLMLTIAAVPLPTIAETTNKWDFDFTDYSPDRYIGMSGRIAPIVEADGNTVIKFDNNGIPYRSSDMDKSNSYTKSGSTYTKVTSADIEAALEADPNAYSNYYHVSANKTVFNSSSTSYNDMEAYNAIELGELEASKSYKITINYKRESLVNPLYVQPVTWDQNANWRNTMYAYNEARITIPTTDTADSDYVTVSTIITTPDDLKDVYKNEIANGNVLRLILFTGVADANNVVYFDNITVEEVEGVAKLTYNYTDGSKSTVPVEVGAKINYAALGAKRNGDTAWSAVEGAYVAPQTVMPDSDYSVYEYYREGFFGFENYYRNEYVALSGRVQPVEIDGNTVIKFDNNGIPLAEKPSIFGTDVNFYTKSGSTYTKYNKDTDVFEAGKYYHASATIKSTDTSVNMDTYNAIELGQIEDGAVYKITVNYKRENVVTPVTVSPRSWNIYANLGRSYQTFYTGANIIIPATDTPDSEWQTETVYISALTANSETKYVLDQLRLVIYAANVVDENNVIYFDDISVEKITAPYVLFDGNNGKNDTLVRGEAGDTIIPPTVTQKGKEFTGWFTDVECTTPFTLDKFAADTAITVYAGWKNLPGRVYDFENYQPNQYISIASRVQPIKEADGNTVIKFDNNGMPYEEKPFFWGKETNIYTKEYVDGKAVYTMIEDPANTPFEPGKYYHASATIKASDATKGMEQYNAIELGKITEGTVYKITINYKRENVITPITVSPRSWNKAANSSRSSQIVYNGKITIPATSTPDTEWQTASTYISAQTTNGQVTKLDMLRLVIYATGIIDENNIVYFDNISVEEIKAPYILFEGQNGENSVLVKGEAGKTITAPKFTYFGKSFNGWFTDKECTKRFTQKTFEADTAVTVYAGWVENRVRKYSFENYTIPFSGNGDFRRLDGEIITTKDAYDGNNVMEFDRRVEGEYNVGRSLVAIAEGDVQCDLNPQNNYLITMRVKVLEKVNGSSVNIDLVTASKNHYSNESSWTAGTKNTDLINTDFFKKKESTDWCMASFIIKGETILENGNYLYLMIRGKRCKVWIDDITVTAFKVGESTVVISDGGCKNIGTTVLIGKSGQNFANKLPKNPVLSGKQFIGYYTKDSQGYYNLLAESDMKFADENYTIYARFVDKKVYQNYEDKGYRDEVASYYFTGPLNYDYEIYDSSAAGNSKDNVTSGRYSLHRKGNSPYNENALLLWLKNQIAEGQRYTVTFNVKLGNYKQTNGAVKIVSCRSYYMSWDTMGDYYSVVPIADLLDGKWHQVSYTFNSVEAFVSLQTPGWVELFIDDIVFTLVDENTPLSVEPSYTDYVQVLLNEDGEIITEEGSGIDISSIIDASLTVGGNDEGISAATIILISAIGGGVILLLVALAVVLILVKRKKKKAKA